MKRNLEDDEISLKLKYQLLREKKEKETQEKKKEDIDQLKLENAKKILAAQKLKEEQEKEKGKQSGFKPPTRRAKRPKIEEIKSKETIIQEKNGVATSEQQDTIFVSGLNDFTDEKELDKTFGRFGPIENIRLIASKNIAFVKYTIPQAANQAIQSMNGQQLVGESGGKIRVAYARPRKSTSKSSTPSNQNENLSHNEYPDGHEKNTTNCENLKHSQDEERQEIAYDDIL